MRCQQLARKIDQLESCGSSSLHETGTSLIVPVFVLQISYHPRWCSLGLRVAQNLFHAARCQGPSLIPFRKFLSSTCFHELLFQGRGEISEERDGLDLLRDALHKEPFAVGSDAVEREGENGPLADQRLRCAESSAPPFSFTGTATTDWFKSK